MADHAVTFPAPGRREQRLLASAAPSLAGHELPYFAISGVADGPTLCVLAGVHGAEYPPIDAAIQFSRAIDPATLRGRIVTIPVVNQPAFWARTPFLCPNDGKNPNRVFPGDPGGSFSQALAHLVFEAVIRRADLLVDLHCGDLVEELVPYCGTQQAGDARVDRRALDLAVAFGLPFVCVEPPPTGAIAGTTDSAAAQAGIPAIYAEAGGIGQLRQSDVALLLRGLQRVLVQFGMLAGSQDPLPPPLMLRDVRTVRADEGGFFRRQILAGNAVAEGDRLGAMTDLWGEPLAEVISPVSGTALFVTTSPAISPGGIIAGVGIPA
jgi:predicted deacylase